MDRRAIILAEVGDRLVVGHETAQEPEKLQIASGFALEPPARLHPVEIAVDVELQENRGVEAWPPRGGGLDAAKPESAEVERIDEGVDRANRVTLINPIIKTLRQECRLPTICPFDEPLHDHPRES